MPHKGNDFLQQAGSIIQNHNQSKCKLVEPRPNGCVYGRGVGKILRARGM